MASPMRLVAFGAVPPSSSRATQQSLDSVFLFLCLIAIEIIPHAELMNEPFAGNIFENPFLMEPGQADLLNLQPFYDIVSPYIRSVDPDRIVFFEGVTWSDLADHGELGLGFTHPPGGIEYNSTSALSFHYYNPPNFSPFNGMKGYFERRLDSIKQLNVGGFLTEFEIDGGVGELTTQDVCDRFQISWLGWEYKTMAGVLPNGTWYGKLNITL